MNRSLPRRSTSRHDYDRNVRIPFDVGHEDDVDGPVHGPVRRSNRISVPVRRYNVGEVTCAACARIFRTLCLHHYEGAIVCSFDCFKKHQP